MAEGTWLLQDSPVFWFVGVAPPPPPLAPPVRTTYDYSFLPGEGVNMEVIAPKLTVEQEYAIWRGDRRYYPGMGEVAP